MVVPTSRETGRPIVMREVCPTHELMGLIGDRWSVLLLIALHDNGELRSADLRRAVDGISQKMLTCCVRRLTEHGLVLRSAEATVPVSVSYRLTPLGESLFDALTHLRAWANNHMADVQAIRDAH